MTRSTLTTILTLIINFCFGQYNHDFRTLTRNAELDKFHNSLERVVFSNDIDSLFKIREQLKDGEKIIYWDNLRQKPHFRFETINGKISGPFYCYNVNGILTTVGNYLDDSLWTFRSGYFLLHDTTFKVGLWRYYALSNPYDSTYYSASTMDRNFKIPFENSGKFKQEWTFLNGQVWEKRVYDNKLGLIEQRIYNKNGSGYSDFERQKNCTITRKWDNEGYLKWISIDKKWSTG